MQAKYIVLIPAYKPMPILLELVHRLSECGCSVIIVDDGSGKEYEHLFSECREYAEILYHKENAGKGAALKTGLAYIHKQYPKDSVIVTVDADGQHRVEDALAVCMVAAQEKNTLVLGSRKLKENVPLRSQLGNSITRFVYSVTTGLKIHDTQTGLRAFRTALIPKLLEIPGERYEYEMNVLLQFAREKIPMIEHDIETVYLDNNSSSHFDVFKDSFRIYKEIMKFSVSSFIGFLIDYLIYSLLLLIGCSLTTSNIIARIVSASVNFTLNRKLVFKSKERLLTSALKYLLLALCILVGNTLVLNVLVNIFGIHQMLAKILTEIVFFILSWLFQRVVVFKRK